MGVGNFLKNAASTVWRGFGGVGFDQMRAIKAQVKAGTADPWQVDNLRAKNVEAMQRLVANISSNLDTFAHSISVKVKGGPAADLRRVYYLALAACFGRYGRGVTRVALGYSELSCHTDVTNKEVTVTVGYRVSALGDIGRELGSAGNDPFAVRTPTDIMHEGPDQVTIGAGWTGPFYTSKDGSYAANEALSIKGGSVVRIPVNRYDIPADTKLTEQAGTVLVVPVGGNNAQWKVIQPETLRLDPVPVNPLRPYTARPVAPDPLREYPRVTGSVETMYLQENGPVWRDAFLPVVRTAGKRTPILPDDGRIITTGETRSPDVQPSRPPVDGIARGGLLGMTVQALADPGFLPLLPSLTSVPIAAGGVYQRAPGSVAPGTQVGNGIGGADEPPNVDLIGFLFGDGLPDPKAAPLMRD